MINMIKIINIIKIINVKTHTPLPPDTNNQDISFENHALKHKTMRKHVKKQAVFNLLRQRNYLILNGNVQRNYSELIGSQIHIFFKKLKPHIPRCSQVSARSRAFSRMFR